MANSTQNETLLELKIIMWRIHTHVCEGSIWQMCKVTRFLRNWIDSFQYITTSYSWQSHWHRSYFRHFYSYLLDNSTASSSFDQPMNKCDWHMLPSRKHCRLSMIWVTWCWRRMCWPLVLMSKAQILVCKAKLRIHTPS